MQKVDIFIHDTEFNNTMIVVIDRFDISPWMSEKITSLSGLYVHE